MIVYYQGMKTRITLLSIVLILKHINLYVGTYIGQHIDGASTDKIHIIFRKYIPQPLSNDTCRYYIPLWFLVHKVYRFYNFQNSGKIWISYVQLIFYKKKFCTRKAIWLDKCYNRLCSIKTNPDFKRGFVNTRYSGFSMFEKFLKLRIFC